jgi:sec-independent protein translocase protein TatC
MSKNVSVNASPLTIAFLVELRSRLLRVFLFYLIVLAVLLNFANQLYILLAHPLLRFLPQGHMIATQLVTPFFVPFKLTMLIAALVTVPYLLYQAWAFVAPALYAAERQLIWPCFLLGVTLFYTGIAFAYIVIFPMLFQFLAHIAPEGVLFSPDISEYLDFTSKLLLVFGGLFEIPMIMMLLLWLDLVPLARFIRWRSYAIIGAFVLGMLFAPPDVMSQTILAVPIWLLYELGILLGRFNLFHKRLSLQRSIKRIE